MIFCISVGLLFGGMQALKASATLKDVIYYSEYGAVGDGVTDDLAAIVRAHAAANEAGLPVRADYGATYYIGGSDQTAIIQTNTDWSNAGFIIDDVNVENHRKNVFNIVPSAPTVEITTVKTLKKGQRKLDLSLLHDAFIVAMDNNTMRYIRMGPNVDQGSPQTDIFVVDKNGNVAPETPILWDFDTITSMVAYPIDSETLTVKGGHFTTIANQEEIATIANRGTDGSWYYNRGIGVMRSNVVIDGVYHAVTGELDHGAPYRAFIDISNCSDVTVQNCVFTGRKTYQTIGRAGTPVAMGTYDLHVNRAANVTVRNSRQTNDINDRTFWGIFASNYSKNLIWDSVEFSRFDAHKGVANATIKNSSIGHQGVNLIGSGVFLMENTKVNGWSFINLREDYGSTFEGDIVIRNCVYIPSAGRRADAVLIAGRNTGQHDFGYPCFMPGKITIDGLVIHDMNPTDGYQGPKLFANFTPENTSENFAARYSFAVTEEVEIRGLTIKSGLPLIISSNPFMFRNVRMTKDF